MDQEVLKRARQFSKASATYESCAAVQQELGRRLIEMLQIRCPRRHFKRICDVGCGTGSFSELLNSAFAPDSLTLCDISAGMLGRCRERFSDREGVDFKLCDAGREALGENYSLVASNAAVQWFQDLPAGLENLKRALTHAGTLAFSVFTWGNLQELRDLGAPGLDYHEEWELQRIVAWLFYWQEIKSHEFVTYYPDAMSMLRTLRDSGVTALDAGAWTPGRLKKFVHEYERRFGSSQGVRLTWCAATVVASDRVFM